MKKQANKRLLCNRDLFIQKIMYKNAVNHLLYIEYSKKGIFINKLPEFILCFFCQSLNVFYRYKFKTSGLFHKFVFQQRNFHYFCRKFLFYAKNTVISALAYNVHVVLIFHLFVSTYTIHLPECVWLPSAQKKCRYTQLFPDKYLIGYAQYSLG